MHNLCQISGKSLEITWIIIIRRLLSACLLLFLSAGLLASAPIDFPGKAMQQPNKDRPEFYALRVIFENNVKNPKDCLGAADGRYAEILPGGQLIVIMENKLYPFPILGIPSLPEEGYGQHDSGSIVGKGEANFSLEGWFPVENEQGKQHYDWMPLGLSATGFIFLPTYDLGLDMIRIANSGTESLFVDAVIGYVREEER